ncbi:tRNA (adenosine(37)-N6)-threonylcarbamoyltransferase complex transferase subunit TsaD [Candidatus Saccharibacteria bacterium]|nr:tRNA (adenosine(37)-N6)-threonylcarbamoyltransferase complex transferase subunit TsaD [Candidatus Saccharibacteria bacterium]
MKVLGIETSCDETAAAVVEDGFLLWSNVVASSMDLQAQYGGVVPEIAARSHIEAINGVVQQALDDAGCTWGDIDAIAVTFGAGLGGSLLIGVLTARTLAIVHNKPLYAINHVEAHVYANFLTEVGELRAHSASGKRSELGGWGQSSSVATNPPKGRRASLDQAAATYLVDYTLPSSQPTFPMLALIVSGGHSQLVLFRDHFDYTLLGQTQDDAIGEAFDKVAKIIGLPYPGGPSVGKKALEGNPHAFEFPKARMTHVRPELQKLRELRIQNSELRVEAEPLRGNNKVSKGDTTSLPNSQFPIPNSAAMQHSSYDFSFSGLKTAVLRTAQHLIGEDHTFPSKNLPERLSEAQKADIAASFQRVAIETVVDKAIAAYEEFTPASVVIAGGVAASPELRRQLSERLPCPIEYTDIRLCTDNGAMVATLGCFHVKYNRPKADPYTLDIAPNLSM